MTGEVRETYHAALQHDLVDLDGDERLVGVVRKPTPWFAQVDENRPELGPPADLLEEVQAKADELESRGMDDADALEAAWEATDFEVRYREYVRSSDEVKASLSDLADRVADGETVVLVCYEADDKPCHRRVLQELLVERVDR